MSRTAIIGVTGLHGVGKTTTLDGMGTMRSDICIIRVGNELKDLSKSQTGTYFFDHGLAERDRLRYELGQSIIERARHQRSLYLLDMHLTDIREGESKVIQPSNLIKAMAGIILLDARDSIILERRSCDPKPHRGLSLSVIAQERLAELSSLRQVHAEYGTPFRVLLTEKALAEVQADMLRLLDIMLTGGTTEQERIHA